MKNLLVGDEFFEDLEELEENDQQSRNYAYPYNADYDYLYNANERSEVTKALNQIGFLDLDQLFYDERIDFDIFTQLDQIGIFEILKKYPVGVRYKFLKAFNQWKEQNLNENNFIGASSSKSISFTSSKSIGQNSVDENTFSKILYGTDEGKKFLSNHPVDKALLENDRRELCTIVCGNLLNENITLGRKEVSTIAKSIPVTYLKEKSECYFDGTKGFLYYKSVNMKTKFKDNGLIDLPPTKKKKVREIGESLTFSKEECTSDDFVKTHPFDSTEGFHFHWKQSAKKRLAELQSETQCNSEIIDKYKSYSRSDGYYFVLMDFQYLHPNVNFAEQWIGMKSNLMKALPLSMTNTRIKNKFNSIDKMKSSAKALIILLALHGQLYSRGSIKSEITEKAARDTIEDSFSQMVSIIKGEESVTMHIADVKNKAKARKLAVQPFLICFGEDIENISDEILLIFDDIKYKFSDIDNALEVLLKLFILFNLKYPPTCKNVYEFLSYVLLNQKFILNSKCQSLLNMLENTD